MINCRVSKQANKRTGVLFFVWLTKLEKQDRPYLFIYSTRALFLHSKKKNIYSYLSNQNRKLISLFSKCFLYFSCFFFVYLFVFRWPIDELKFMLIIIKCSFILCFKNIKKNRIHFTCFLILVWSSLQRKSNWAI